MNSWIADLPDSRLAGFQDTSLTAFEIAAAAYMEPVMETAKKEAVDRSILAQVKRATSFWATFLAEPIHGRGRIVHLRGSDHTFRVGFQARPHAIRLFQIGQAFPVSYSVM